MKSEEIMQRIIITNQHSDNRGDESAVIGMIKSLRKRFGEDTQITILLQTQGYQFLEVKHGVTEKNMITTLGSFAILTLWILCKQIGIDIRNVIGSKLKDFVELHEEADLVISSCGGPYIGDLYANHEILHIMHLFLAFVLKKNTAFYAPSMGPFNHKFLNPLRKLLLDNVGVIVLRDKVSYQYVKMFVPNKDGVYLTTDSCLSDEIVFEQKDNRKNVIGITPLDYSFPLRKETKFYKQQYEDSIISVLNQLMKEDVNLKVMFFPQLYGKHSDLPFIRKLISGLNYPERTVIFPDSQSGPDQQLEISKMKYMIATRYHSAIFAAKTLTPLVTIYYEHKAQAFMESVGLSSYAMDIYSINSEQLLAKIALLQENYELIHKTLSEKIPALSSLANKTAEYIYKYTSIDTIL